MRALLGTASYFYQVVGDAAGTNPIHFPNGLYFCVSSQVAYGELPA